MSEIAAIVLNYRTPDRTLLCLQSLREEDIHWIVLVENSADQGFTWQTMRDGVNALVAQGIRIDVLNPHRNLGFAAGVNLALAHIHQTQRQPDVLLLNSDARLLPGCLTPMKAAVRNGSDIVAPIIQNPLRQEIKPILFYHNWFALVTQKPLMGSFPFLTGACLLLSHQIAQRNLLDEDFFFYGEDVRLSHQWLQEKRRIALVEQSRVMHDGAGSAHNGSLFYEYHINRGHWLLAIKLHQSVFQRWTALAARLIWLCARALVRTIRFRNAAALKGLVMAISDVLNNAGPRVIL